MVDRFFGPRKTCPQETRFTRDPRNPNPRPPLLTETFNVGTTHNGRKNPANRIDLALPLIPAHKDAFNGTIGGGTSKDARRRARRQALRRA